MNEGNEVTHLHSINPGTTDRSHTDVAMVDGLILQREKWQPAEHTGVHLDFMKYLLHGIH